MLISTLIKKNHFHFEKDFFKKLILILIPSALMALTLLSLRNHFDKSDYLSKISELIIMISLGLLVYGAVAFLSGSLNILIKSNLFKRKKSDIIPNA
jgi:chromate transport protein ChrA